METAVIPLVFSLFWPVPRQIEPLSPWTLRLPAQVSAPDLLRSQGSLLERELVRLFGSGAVAARGRSAFRLLLDPASLRRPEEYCLETLDSGVVLRAGDAQGAYWAVHSLVQLLGSARPVPEGYAVAGVRLHDWPETSFRAFMTQGAWGGTPAEIRRTLELFARMKIRYFAHEFGPQVVLDFDPSIARGIRLPKARAKELIAYGRSLGLEPIGYLNLLGHLERAYVKEPYTGHGGILIGDEEVYDKFVYPILAEMLEVYGPVKYFHCGMDEAWGLFEWYARQGKDPAELLATHVRKVRDFLSARGVTLVIWHDMLVAPDLRQQLDAPIGPANGGPPRNTARALAQLPKDVVLNYWHYDSQPRYPTLDYLQGQGFAVWASPWQTPFSLVRYAQQRGVPTMGTLWCGPPSCFFSQVYHPVTALYAQAAWNPTVAPDTVAPEPAIRARAEAATTAALWARPSRVFSASQAVLLAPRGDGPAIRLAWPRDARKAPEILAGVPFRFARPATVAPLPARTKALDLAQKAAYVELHDGERLVLDGVNVSRGTNQLILYAAPRTSTGTNVYGVEVAVSATGEVLEVSDYGSGNHSIPAGGFVLSAHLGDRPAKGNRLRELRPGNRIAVVDGEGNWLGGHEPGTLTVVLPQGAAVTITGVDSPRGHGDVILYQPGYGNGRTGTNAHGVEVVVRKGRVVAVRRGEGDTSIPEDGYVLSAHRAEGSQAASLLEALALDSVLTLRFARGGKSLDLLQVQQQPFCRVAVGYKCLGVYIALATELAGCPGALLGTCVRRYASGREERVFLRYAHHALPLEGTELPQRFGEAVWLAERSQAPKRVLVVEWVDKDASEALETLRFEPAAHALEVGLQVLAVTAAVR